jgi:hypothetical protein
MAKASRVGLALSEETLTETALYEMALAHELDGKIAISLATKPQEAVASYLSDSSCLYRPLLAAKRSIRATRPAACEKGRLRL